MHSKLLYLTCIRMSKNLLKEKEYSQEKLISLITISLFITGLMANTAIACPKSCQEKSGKCRPDCSKASNEASNAFFGEPETQTVVDDTE